MIFHGCSSIIWNPICLEYNFAKFIVPVSQVHFAKSRTQIDFTILPNCKVHTFPNSKVDVAKSPSGDGSFRMIL